MIFKGRRQSTNVIDQRRFGGGKMGGGALIIGAVIYFLMGGNPLEFLVQNAPIESQTPISSERDEEKKAFASVVLADTEDVWDDLFKDEGADYRAPKMVLYRGAVRSACGHATSAVGPFYCPADERMYLDLSFFEDLEQKLGASGDFAQAYVIAHEVGHHIQQVLGKTQRDPSDNRASVSMELQADCLAGVWAKQTEETKQVLEQGDIQEAMSAASAVGDDRLQQQAQGHVVPDSFTHGTSTQRASAFRTGYSGGTLQACL
jgi:uncharacterized protein